MTIGSIFKDNFVSGNGNGNDVIDTYFFGCAQDTTVPVWADGILGLAQGESSIVQQQGFGYCLDRMRVE